MLRIISGKKLSAHQPELIFSWNLLFSVLTQHTLYTHYAHGHHVRKYIPNVKGILKILTVGKLSRWSVLRQLAYV